MSRVLRQESIACGAVMIHYKQESGTVVLRDVHLVPGNDALLAAGKASERSDEPLRTWITFAEHSQ